MKKIIGVVGAVTALSACGTKDPLARENCAVPMFVSASDSVVTLQDTVHVIAGRIAGCSVQWPVEWSAAPTGMGAIVPNSDSSASFVPSDTGVATLSALPRFGSPVVSVFVRVK